MIVVIDYGIGNLRSVQKAVEFLGYSVKISALPEDIISAEKVILPGVGAYARAMDNLCSAGLLDAVKQVLNSNKPFLGVCLGMQLLLSSSEEHGLVQGLDYIPGTVNNFRSAQGFEQRLAVPHMGWNKVKAVNDSKLFSGLGKTFEVYFVHSYYAAPQDEKYVIGSTEYGVKFCSALNKGNVFGIQFHPEKSGKIGLKILKNFLELR